MTYTPDIPISGDTLGSTRDRIRGNFQQIAIVEAVNHVAFNNTGEGKHKFLQMPEQVSAPTTLVNEAGFYAKQAANPAESNLYFRGESNGYEYQLTRATSASTARFANNTAYAANHVGGWTFLPGGMLFQYGLRTATPAATSYIITFPVPFTATPYNIQLTSVLTNNSTVRMNVKSGSLINTQFATENTSSGNLSGIYWWAIGL